MLGVNDDMYDPAKHHIISNASCTTNCLATAVKPIVDGLGWVSGFMTTIHSYTNDQNILDAPHKDLRRARNAATNIIPTSTGAAKALYLTIPEIEGTFDGFALRVPTPTVSMIYLVVQAKRETTREEVNAILRGAAESGLKEYVQYTEEELVSSDFKRNPYSSIIDGKLTNANGDLIQIAAWYDNEWGYSCRLADLAQMVLERSRPASRERALRTVVPVAAAVLAAATCVSAPVSARGRSATTTVRIVARRRSPAISPDGKRAVVVVTPHRPGTTTRRRASSS